MALNLRLITPEGIFWQGDCTMVTLPGLVGDVGILENHAHSIIQMKPGLASIYEGTQISEKYFLTGGVIHIGDRCDVLCEEVLTLESMNLEELKKQSKNLQEDISLSKDIHEIKLLQHQLKLADSQIRALSSL